MDFSRQCLRGDDRTRSGMFLSPFQGSHPVNAHPGLTPWAAFFRRFAAGIAGAGSFSNVDF
jgi:hypothetical protein